MLYAKIWLNLISMMIQEKTSKLWKIYNDDNIWQRKWQRTKG